MMIALQLVLPFEVQVKIQIRVCIHIHDRDREIRGKWHSLPTQQSTTVFLITIYQNPKNLPNKREIYRRAYLYNQHNETS